MLLRHLYFCCNDVTSSINFLGQRKIMSETFCQISLKMQSITQSLSQWMTNVTTLYAKQEDKACVVTYINFVVCNLGLASQEVTFCQIQPMKTCKTSIAMIRRQGRTFLSKHKLKSARRHLIRVSSRTS
jgi:hypothetical protein